MNLEALQARLKNLNDEAKKLETALIQISGAIADCQYWIAELSKKGESSHAPEEKQVWKGI